MLTFLETWTLSWITQLFPILMAWLPNNVAPYQIDVFSFALTFPMIVALGATKSVYYSCGLTPSKARFLKLGTILSSDPNSPSILLPTWYIFRPIFLKKGPVNLYWTFIIISYTIFFISLQLIFWWFYL